VKIKDIEFFWLDVPFHEVPQRNMERNNHDWRISEVCRVVTDDGLVGYGETMPNYTWARVNREAAAQLKGQNPFDHLWNDSLGAGLQMALFDVAGKAVGVPAHRLLGQKCREWCPISWWATDMSPEDYGREVRSAAEQGYTCCKQKPRPYWDVYEQVRQSAENSPEDFKVDMDFNAFLVNAGTAVSVLKEIEKCPKVTVVETPIPQHDVEGYRRIRQQTRSAIAIHYGTPPAATALRQEMCDGFVICAGAKRILEQFGVVAEMNMPGWLQLVGTGITTAWTLHLGAVCTHAIWPAITCMNMYVDPLIVEPIQVKGGYARVPEAPGLGVEFNESALKYRVDSPVKPAVTAIYAFVRANGEKTWFAGEMVPRGYWPEFSAGNYPLFEHEVRLERWDDDGSKEWRDLAERVKTAPVKSVL
jgi:L-alanine-DL-glutamate epimerase-like enolase superfamily enzyme